MTNNWRKLFGLGFILLGIALSGCGKKSDLTLPEKQSVLAGFAEQHAASTKSSKP